MVREVGCFQEHRGLVSVIHEIAVLPELELQAQNDPTFPGSYAQFTARELEGGPSRASFLKSARSRFSSLSTAVTRSTRKA